MAKREFVMLAHNYNPKKHGVGGWWWSEKLDGMFSYWDGGVSRGLPKAVIPWANTDKDDRYVREQICTGLWSRYGNVIHAHETWLDQMPLLPLCGELFIRRGQGGRQELMSTVKDLNPDKYEWSEVRFYAYNMPAYETIFADGVINNTNFKKNISWQDCSGMIDIEPLDYVPKVGLNFRQAYYLMTKHLEGRAPMCKIVRQTELPFNTKLAHDAATALLYRITEADGEGLILINPEKGWIPERTHDLLKMKDINDSEGIVTGYTSGRETDLGSKLLGKMGALILDIGEGKRLELSGFTDEERELHFSKDSEIFESHREGLDMTAEDWARRHPGQEAPDWVEATHFPRGTKVTFKYRDKSADGIPQEARYFRKRED